MAQFERARPTIDRQPPALLLAAVGTGILVGLAAVLSLTESRSLIPLGFAALGSLLALRSQWLMAAAVALMFVNPGMLPPLVEVQGFTIRIIDAVAIVLAAHVVVRMLLHPHRRVLSVSGGRIFGLTAAFLIYVGMTLMIPLFNYPDHFPAAAISYVRLVSSFGLAITLYAMLDRMRALALLTGVMIAAAFINGLVATGQWIQSGVGSLFHPSLRVGGLLGPDGLGLAGSLLLVLSLAAARRRPARLSRVAGAIGVLMGILMLLVSKSASAIVAAGVGASLMLLFRRPRVTRKQFIVATCIFVVGCAAVVGLRWFDVVGLFEVSGGSFTQRLVVGYAAWVIFLEHPLLGVGWQTSWLPAVIGHPHVTEQVLRRFGDLPPVLLPDENPTSVHNFYLQVLAELGIVGVVLLLAVVVLLIREGGRLLHNPSPGIRDAALQWTVVLVLLGTWLNTNPLFGGHLSAYLLFLAFAVIAALPRLDISGRLTTGPASPVQAPRPSENGGYG